MYGIGLAEPCWTPNPPVRPQSTLVPAAFQRPTPPPWPVPFPRLPKSRPPAADTKPSPGTGTDEGPCIVRTEPDPHLRTLADENGGGYFELHTASDLSATFARVAEELHHQYLLAFSPKVFDGQVHTLEVRVRRPGLTARARRSYVAAPDR